MQNFAENGLEYCKGGPIRENTVKVVWGGSGGLGSYDLTAEDVCGWRRRWSIQD